MVWFLGSLGALLGGLEFRGPALLGLLALDPTDSLFLKDVSTGITGFGPPRGALSGLFRRVFFASKRS